MILVAKPSCVGEKPQLRLEIGRYFNVLFTNSINEELLAFPCAMQRQKANTSRLIPNGCQKKKIQQLQPPLFSNQSTYHIELNVKNPSILMVSGKHTHVSLLAQEGICVP